MKTIDKKNGEKIKFSSPFFLYKTLIVNNL